MTEEAPQSIDKKSRNPAETAKLALQHSRELFIYHAGQRIQSLNFYFVAIAVFLTGFGFLATSKVEPEDRAFFGIVLAFGGFYITRLFQQLDKRNEQLVHRDESLLKFAEQILAEWSEPPATLPNSVLSAWEVTARANEPAEESKDRVRHYADIVPNIFGLYQTLSLIGGIYSVWPWTKAVLGF